MKAQLIPPVIFCLFALGQLFGRANGFSTDLSSQTASISSEQLVRHKTCMYARRQLPDEENDKRKEQLRQLLCLDQEGIDKLVSSYPEALKIDLDRNVAPKSEMLQRMLGIDQKSAGRILSCPGASRLIGQKQDTLEAKIDYLQKKVGMTKKQLAKVLVAYPSMLARSIEDHYEPLFKAVQTSFGFSQDEVAGMITANPRSFYSASVKEIETIAFFLPQVLGLDEKDQKGLKKCIKRYPSLLYSGESQARESYEWILDLLGNSQSTAARVCRNKPQLLASNTETLQNKVDWYQERLSLSDEEIGKIISSYPRALTLSFEDGIMEQKVCRLMNFFGINEEEFRDLILKRPEPLALSFDKNIEPKIELYGSLLGKERAKKLVLESPNLLLQSMDKCLNPRIREVERAYEYVKWDKTLVRRLATRRPKHWCKYMLDDGVGGPGEKLNDSGKYKRLRSKT